MMAGLEPWAQQALSVGSGLIAGVLVGLERGFKLRNQQEGHRVAGIRTFAREVYPRLKEAFPDDAASGAEQERAHVLAG